MEFEEFVGRLVEPVETGAGVSSRCPGHADQVRSLMTNRGDHGGIVVHCHAGCKPQDVVAAMGLTLKDLMGEPYLQAQYPYYALDGTLLYTVQRWANPKTFRCSPGLPPVAERILYQLTAIEWARANGHPLYIVEGEKDVHRLAEAQLPATTNVGGAGKWYTHYAESLVDVACVVVADNDQVGRAHARAVAGAIKGKARSVAVMVSPHGKDISDLLDAGYGVDALQLLPEGDELQAFVASTIKLQPVEWLWPGYIPLGKLVMIEGDPGDGKSVLTIDLAARFSSGRDMPDGALNLYGPVQVGMVSAEDDLADTIGPRLVAAGANMENVHLVDGGSTPDSPFTFEDLPVLMAYVREKKIRVLVFDPLTAFFGERTDTHNDASVRRGLQPLKILASRTGVAIIVVRHLNKASGGKAIYRGGGSIAFTGAARMTYLVAPKPDQPDVRVMACVKSNLAAKPASLTYTLGVADDVPYLVWGEAIAETAQELLDGPGVEDDEDRQDEARGKRRLRLQAREFLVELLGPGALGWSDIVEAGKAEGYSEITLRRARTEEQRLEKRRTNDGRTEWFLVNLPDWANTTPTGDALTPTGEGTCSLALFAQQSEPRETRAGGEQVPDSSDISMDELAPPAHQVAVFPGAKNGEQTEQVSTPEAAADEDEAFDPADFVRGLPMICCQCFAVEDLVRVGDPHWSVYCVRCRPVDGEVVT